VQSLLYGERHCSEDGKQSHCGGAQVGNCEWWLLHYVEMAD
jgi:hypothetical protein